MSDVQAALKFVDDAVTRLFEISSVCSGGTTLVFKAFERERRRIVALKLKRGAFVNSVAARSSYREVVYLKQLGGHPNIAELRETYVCANGNDLCLTFRFMETDLKASIIAGRLLPIHRTYVATQLLTALEFLHAARVAHRDVEPTNVLLDPACNLQLTGQEAGRDGHDCSCCRLRFGEVPLGRRHNREEEAHR
jgi:mitogen-activated protein kinase 15